MRTTTISVTEAARNFADCVNRAHYQNVTFVLLRNGSPVARLVPDNEKVCKGRELAELLAFEGGTFPADHPFAPIAVVPEKVALPPIFLLGSSGASAAAAGELGVGYSFAAHFSATPPAPAFAAYRAAFRPSARFDKPHAILAVSALVAPTEEEAKFLSSSQAVSWALFHSGELRRLVAPEQASRWPLTPAQQAIVDKQGKLWIVGDPQQVRATIEAQAEAAGADEVMVTTTVWSHEHRLRSYRLLAEAFGLTPRAS